MPARRRALSQAVLLFSIRFPAKVKHQRECWPIVDWSAAMASTLSGMPRPSPDLVAREKAFERVPRLDYLRF
jgi:hypothetical protein